jgi:hypothetical protein
MPVPWYAGWAGPASMDLRDYYAVIAGLPLPSQQQLDQLSHYISIAHGWHEYGLDGGEIVVFFDPEAGTEVTSERPHPWRGWTTCREYIESFGHLSYGWRYRSPSELRTDHGGARAMLDLPPEIQADCRGRLYPFLPGRNGVELMATCETELRQLQDGKRDHPQRELLVGYYSVAKRYLSSSLDVDEAKKRLGSVERTRRDSQGAGGIDWTYRRADPSYSTKSRQLDEQAKLLRQTEELASVRRELKDVLTQLGSQAMAEITGALSRLLAHLKAAGLAGTRYPEPR